MVKEKVTFEGSQGGQLAALLDTPAGQPVAYALFAHCFTCSKDVFAASRIAKALTAYGIAVLRFDFTGLGASDGEFANSNFSSNVDDVVRAAGFLREEHQAPSLLVGHSLGGAAVLAAASEVPEAVGVVTIGAPCDPAHVTHLFKGALDDIGPDDEVEVSIGGRDFTVRGDFLDDITEGKLALDELGAALCVFHSPDDEIVGAANGRHLFEEAAEPKSFISLPGADHLLTDQTDAIYVADVMAAWATRYLSLEDGDDGRTERGVVRVREVGTYTQQIEAGPHRLTADEPPGTGEDLGPTPYDLLLASLGACTSMTLRMYADRKEWPLDAVAVTLTYNRMHAKDCEDCESDEGFVHEMVRVIDVAGDLDDEQRERLVEIADRCPVHRTLTETKRIHTRLA